MCALVPVHTCMTEDVHLTELDLGFASRKAPGYGLETTPPYCLLLVCYFVC